MFVCPPLSFRIPAGFLGYSENRGRTPVMTDLADLELLEQFFTHKQVVETSRSHLISDGRPLQSLH